MAAVMTLSAESNIRVSFTLVLADFFHCSMGYIFLFWYMYKIMWCSSWGKLSSWIFVGEYRAKLPILPLHLLGYSPVIRLHLGIFILYFG